MTTIRVLALAPVMGMVRGREYTLPASATVDALLDRGFVLWLDMPVAEPVVTPEVKKRAKKAAVAVNDLGHVEVADAPAEEVSDGFEHVEPAAEVAPSESGHHESD